MYGSMVAAFNLSAKALPETDIGNVIEIGQPDT